MDSRTNFAKEISALLRRPMAARSKYSAQRSPILFGLRKSAPREKAFLPTIPAARWQRATKNLTKEVLKLEKQREKIELASVDDLFSTEEGRQDAKLEKIQEIPLTELHPFKNHPFKVKDDEAMMETADSIKQYGVLVPAIARPDPEGGYELVAGHRRHRASELAEKETMPVIVRDLDDDAATIIMVDSNLQRESLLPSERAFAYKMKLEAVKHQGARTGFNFSPTWREVADLYSKVADQAGKANGRYSAISV